MRDTLPRKPTTAVAEIKKGLKDSLYGNGMSSGSPTPSGGSSSPAQDIGEGAPNCIPPMMPKPPPSSVNAGAVASPLSSPGIRVSPKHNLRRNQSTDSKHKNQLFDFDGQLENNFCNNNNSKLTRRHSSKPDDHTSRTPSRNSVSDELSSSSLTPTTDEQTNSAGGQNLELNAIFDVDVDDEMLHKVLKGIEKGQNDSLELSEGPLEFDVSSFQNSSDALLYENNPLRTTQPELPPLEGLGNSPSSPQQYTPTVSANSTSARGIPQTAMVSSTSSPASATKFSPPSSSDSTNSKIGKSHLQDILGVTDTIRLKNMSRPIDTVPYKSPTTTTSYSMTGMKPTPNTPSTPSTMAPPNRMPSNVSFNNKPPRPQYMFSPDIPTYRPNSQAFQDNGTNGPWSRGSPRLVPPNLIKSPPFSGHYVETSMSPSLVNPMSGLQNTVDSIPAAPVGTSEPGTPVMGPPPLRSPHGFEAATPSPGGGRMRPPPSPSVMNDKRCVSADSVSAGTNGKKAGNKRERTRSADSKEDDKKETSGPKNKRRKSRSKDENITGKKESKTPGRIPKEEKFPRQDSALSGLLDVQTSNPYIYIFNTDTANKAASTVKSSEVPDIILFHQSFLGNCKLRPSENFKPKTSSSEQPRLSDTPSMSMPTTCRSPTEIPAVKSEAVLQKSPRISPPHSNPENVQAINLQDMKPMLLPTPEVKADPISEPVTSQPAVTPQNGVQQQQQEELSAEKRRKREDKLEKLRKMQGLFLKENPENPNIGNNNNPMPRGHVWPPGHPPHHPGQMPYGSMPMDERPPGMKEMPMPNDAMMPPSGQPMSQENAEWNQLIQKHNAEKRRQQEVGMRGDLPTRPPPPYGMNGPQTRWMGPEGYPVDTRMTMDPINHPRFSRSGHRQLVRMPQDPRIPAAYMPPRMGIPRGPYPPNQQQRMSVYEPYMGTPGMRHPTRLPHPGHTAHPAMRPPSENFPFSEQLMKQASFYSSNMPPYDSEPQMGPEWAGPEGPQRLPHLPGSTSPAMGPQSMMNPMEMNPRMTPGMPNRAYEPHMPSYNPDMGQRYDVIPMGSPTGPMDPRIRGPSGTSMMDAIARRGVQRPPDLNLSNQLPPRSPMNYHGPGPMPSPSVNAMNQPVRYPNPNDMGHPPQPSPMHTRSPQMVMGQPQLPMGPSSAGVEPQQVMMGPGPQLSGGPPHSAGPLSNPPPNDWAGHNMPPGTPTPNSSMLHPGNMMQPGGMTSQPGMMSSQPGMMSGMQQPQPGSMMTSPVMMSQPGMMTSQSQVLHRMPHTPSTKPTPNVLSIIKERMSSFKMPEKTPIYQDAVKDTATPPPMTHQNDVPHMSHNPMPGGMRMPVPNHLQSVPYDARMVPPRMSAPHHMNENFQPGYPGGGHPSPMSGPPMAGHTGNGMVMNMGGHEHMGPPQNEYPQPRPNFPEMPEFDLRNILPSERPSQTISYLPPEGNNDQFHSTGPGWGNEGIRPQPQLMPGPSHPANRPPML